MKKIFAVIKTDKTLWLRFLLVFCALSAMVLISAVFGTNMVEKNVASYGNEVINSAVETLRAYLDSYSVTLNDISFSIERLKHSGADTDKMRKDIIEWTDWMLMKSKRFSNFNGIYGYVDGEYIDGVGWTPPSDYIPEERPWYKGAYRENGGVFFSNPYTDALTGNFIITASKIVYDENSLPFGVIAVDVFISEVYDFVIGLQLMNGGNGILLNSGREIVIHKNRNLIGTPIADVNGGNGGYKEFDKLLESGQTVSAFPFTSYTGVESFAFYRQLSNGWYIGVSSPQSVYYGDIYVMVMLMSAAGMAFFITICFVITFLRLKIYNSDEVNRIKASFLSNISNGIRDPLNSVIGISDLMLEEKPTSRQHGYISEIKASSHALLSSINDILDLSGIEFGKTKLVPVSFNFKNFIEGINSAFKLIARKKGLEFILLAEGELPEYIQADDVKLKQMLSCICGNAVKFTNSGYIRLKIKAAVKKLIFEIKDTGEGIPEDDLKSLFGTFSQKNILSGKGLGLSVCKIFVDMMGGKISVESEFGTGTTITVSIPKITSGANDDTCEKN